jgi:hypothetical protein
MVLAFFIAIFVLGLTLPIAALMFYGVFIYLPRTLRARRENRALNAAVERAQKE